MSLKRSVNILSTPNIAARVNVCFAWSFVIMFANCCLFRQLEMWMRSAESQGSTWFFVTVLCMISARYSCAVVSSIELSCTLVVTDGRTGWTNIT